MDCSIQTSTPLETQRVAAHVAGRLDRGGVIALAGDLGAGKTCFVKGLAEGLGLDPAAISSPTFTLVEEHELPDGRLFVHVDAWRLGGDEVDDLGLDEHFQDAETIVAVEWAARIAHVLPDDHLTVALDILTPEHRTVTITPVGDEVFDMGSPGTCPVCSMDAAIITSPFCSHVCRLVDLGKWFDESHVIQRPCRGDDAQ